MREKDVFFRKKRLKADASQYILWQKLIQLNFPEHKQPRAEPFPELL
jgi:hypothetical protein